MAYLTNIDLVGAKTGRKLSWADRAINNSVNWVCTKAIALTILSVYGFVAYLVVKLIIFLVNV